MEQENKKFNEEEMKSINDIRLEYQNKVIQFGQITLEEKLLNQQFEKLNSLRKGIEKEFEKLQEKEKELVKILNNKYGQGTLNPQTGEFKSVG